MGRLAAIFLMLMILVSACGGSPSASSGSTGASSSPGPSVMPTTEPAVFTALIGKWHNPDVDYEYYYNFTDGIHVKMHVQRTKSKAEEVTLRYYAYDGHLVITTDTDEEAGNTTLFRYTYTLSGSVMELAEVGGTDQKTLTKIS